MGLCRHRVTFLDPRRWTCWQLLLSCWSEGVQLRWRPAGCRARDRSPRECCWFLANLVTWFWSCWTIWRRTSMTTGFCRGWLGLFGSWAGALLVCTMVWQRGCWFQRLLRSYGVGKFYRPHGRRQMFLPDQKRKIGGRIATAGRGLLRRVRPRGCWHLQALWRSSE